MANTENIVAYGELTILDLLDTATYIYYAENNLGAGATSAPNSKSKYIGFYSGPPFEGFPDNIPMENWKAEWWSGWSQYVGEKGDKGDGIKETKFYYMVSDTSENHPLENDPNWSESIPSDIEPGDFLWIKTVLIYDDGSQESSYSLSYLGEDGENGAKYRIDTSHINVLQVYNSASDSFSFAPNELSFYIVQGDEKIELPDSFPVVSESDTVRDIKLSVSDAENSNLITFILPKRE
jgi:hypothetical protein